LTALDPRRPDKAIGSYSLQEELISAMGFVGLDRYSP
jgi:hypothetical protein